jgi:hypothetical protein
VRQDVEDVEDIENHRDITEVAPDVHVIGA